MSVRPRPLSLVMGMAILIAVSGAGCRRDDFERARRDPSRRPAYLRSLIAKKGLPPYVSRVEYVEHARVHELLPATRSLPVMPAMLTVRDDLHDEPGFGLAKLSRVLVLPEAFGDQIESETVLELGLFEHEILHARLTYEGLAPSDPWARIPPRLTSLAMPVRVRIEQVLGELVCYQNELLQSQRVNVSERYRQIAKAAYLEYYLSLFEIPGVPDALRADLLAELFQDWMQRQAAIFSATDGGWRFEVAGHRYPLPPAAVESIRAQGAVPTR